MYPPTPLPPAPVESTSGSPGGGGHCGRPGSALLDTGPFYLRLRENAAPSAAPCGVRAAGCGLGFLRPHGGLGMDLGPRCGPGSPARTFGESLCVSSSSTVAAHGRGRAEGLHPGLTLSPAKRASAVGSQPPTRACTQRPRLRGAGILG